MLVNCNSCQKKFTVPDSAITVSGRLLQCGYCENKWTQYPIKEKLVKEIKKIKPAKIIQPTSINKIKTSVKKKKREVSLYSEDYLKNKYGLTIKASPDQQDKKQNKKKGNKTNFGFYNYLITISIFIVALFGFINLLKDFIIARYPVAEPYINYLYEIIDIMKIMVFELTN
tara:strand:- start:314 stop:826 length:513 start_codon:yes stop_codon:yes gene_type:complete